MEVASTLSAIYWQLQLDLSGKKSTSSSWIWNSLWISAYSWKQL